MAIKIETRKIGIPVQIGELEFTFDTSDSAIESLAKKHEIIVEKIGAIKSGDDDGAKNVLREGFDLLLGAGAFDKIYSQTPSAIECIKYLYALLEGITNELKMINPINTQQARVEQYLNHKNPSKPKKKKRK